MTGEQWAFPPARVYSGPYASLSIANRQFGPTIQSEIALALRPPIHRHWLMIYGMIMSTIRANLQAGETSTETRTP